MNIELDQEHCLRSDAHQYTITQKRQDGRGVFVLGYYITIKSALENYIDYKLRMKQDITTIQMLLDYQNSLLTNLNKALSPLKFEVIKRCENGTKRKAEEVCLRGQQRN